MIFLVPCDDGARRAPSRGFLFPSGHVAREPKFISLQAGSEWRFGPLYPVTLYFLFPVCVGREQGRILLVLIVGMDVFILDKYSLCVVDAT